MSKVFDNEDFGFHKITVERPLRLNFQVSIERIARIEDEKGFQKLASSKKKDERKKSAEIAAGRERQQALRVFLAQLQEATSSESTQTLFTDEADFDNQLKKLEKSTGFRLTAPERKAVLSALSERDEQAAICVDAKGIPRPDPELRDTESVPLKELIEVYVAREVLPHVPDAWIDDAKTKIGYEIPLNRHFYLYEPPRALAEIEADIRSLESEILQLLGKVTA